FMKVGNVDPATIYCPVGNAVSSVQKGFFLSYGTLSVGSPRQVGFSIMRGVSGSSVYAKSTTNSINDTGWHHIAVVGDGTTVKMYVDGVQNGAAVTFTGSNGDSSFDVLLGGTRAVNGTFSNGFSGGLDGLLVFDRTLTDEEVAALATGKPTEDIDAETLSQKYRYGYQGKYAERDEETGWNHFELREYDPVIGRWLQYDPKGQFYSPYVGMGNDPVSGIDPDGGWGFWGAIWRSLSHGCPLTSTVIDGKRIYGYIDKQGFKVFGGESTGTHTYGDLSSYNQPSPLPEANVEVYANIVVKTELVAGKDSKKFAGSKISFPYYGVQISADTETDSYHIDQITYKSGSYVSYKFKNNKVDVRLTIPPNGISRGDFIPGLRVLYTFRSGKIPELPIGTWKLQGDIVLNPLRNKPLSFGGRFGVETLSFPNPDLQSGMKLEVNVGFRVH
ncbi:MAG: hypothetical protein HOP30_22305, partial [Cyclobacteriaceae bacterium]|nr:hypothetical protein [Cyclobacteriaceae bacterium]